MSKPLDPEFAKFLESGSRTIKEPDISLEHFIEATESMLDGDDSLVRAMAAAMEESGSLTGVIPSPEREEETTLTMETLREAMDAVKTTRMEEVMAKKEFKPKSKADDVRARAHARRGRKVQQATPDFVDAECLTPGCPNRKSQGAFDGDFCVPCVKSGGHKVAIKKARQAETAASEHYQEMQGAWS